MNPDDMEIEFRLLRQRIEGLELNQKVQRKRMAEIEASLVLKGMAPFNEKEAIVAEVCHLAGIKIAACLGRSREAETCRRRAVVIDILRHDCGWKVREIAKALDRDPAQVFRALRRRNTGEKHTD